MRRAWTLVVVLVGCGGDDRAASAPAPVEPPAASAVVEGDPLLAEARRQVAGGALAAGPRAAILASGAPVHARARALLAALEPAAAPAPASAPLPAPTTPVSAPEVPAVAVDHRAPPEPAVATVAKPRPTV
ncbi:MAG: hypothetical protein JNK45_15970, partial [Myxococcales bacterium]|nr:hypothetical protein [Myxococcales bacterium]